MKHAQTKGISLVILGIVAIIAVVGLVLLFSGTGTGKFTGRPAGAYCGNGIVEPGEMCDPPSPPGAQSQCGIAQICHPSCYCMQPAEYIGQIGAQCNLDEQCRAGTACINGICILH